MRSKVGVLLAEPDEDLRHWLGRLLERTPGFTLLGHCSQASEIESLAAKLRPQLILLDNRMVAGMAGGTLFRLKKSFPNLFVALMDLESGRHYQRLALHSGADIFFCKGRATDSLNNILEILSKEEQA